MAAYVPFIGNNLILSFKSGAGSGAVVPQDPSTLGQPVQQGKRRFAAYVYMDLSVEADKSLVLVLAYPDPWVDGPTSNVGPVTRSPVVLHNLNVDGGGSFPIEDFTISSSPPLRNSVFYDSPTPHVGVLIQYKGELETGVVYLTLNVDFGYSAAN